MADEEMLRELLMAPLEKPAPPKNAAPVEVSANGNANGAAAKKEGGASPKKESEKKTDVAKGAEKEKGRDKDGKKKHKHKHSKRSPSRSKSPSRSRSRSRSPVRSPIRSPVRSRSRSPPRRSPRRSRSPARHRSPSPPSRRRRSPSPFRRRRSPSPPRNRMRSRRSPSPPRRFRRRSPSPRRRSPSPRFRSRSPPRGRSPPPPAHSPSPSPQKRSKSPRPSSEERDACTVVCMQLARNCTPRDLRAFFNEKDCKVRDVRMIADRRVSSRTKGIAYVEFSSVDSVAKALALNGERLLGAPIMVQHTQSEKNRLAAQKAKEDAPKRLSVTNLPPSTTREQLVLIFENLGKVRECFVYTAPDGVSPSTGMVAFESAESARLAFENLQNFPLGERLMGLAIVAEAPLSMDKDEAEKEGVPLSSSARAALMSKLGGGSLLPSAPLSLALPASSRFLLLRNMFRPEEETEEGWEEDIREEALEGCSKQGEIVHIFVDKASQGHVYVKFLNSDGASAAQQHLNGRFFDGRQIVAEFLPEPAYLVKCPEAAAAVNVILPEFA